MLSLFVHVVATAFTAEAHNHFSLEHNLPAISKVVDISVLTIAFYKAWLT